MSQAAHEAIVEHRQVKTSSDRAFGLTVGPILMFIAGVRLWLDHGTNLVNFTLGGIGLALLVLGAVAPRFLAPLNRAWTKLALLLAAIVNPIVMLLMFALVFAPIAIVMRIAGRDTLQRRRDASAQSYWIVRDPPGPKPEGMVNQF